MNGEKLSDRQKLERFLAGCDRCSETANNILCDSCLDRLLYDAYLLGCEDECIPEPKTAKEFKNIFTGLGSGIVGTCKSCGGTEGISHLFDCPEAQD